MLKRSVQNLYDLFGIYKIEKLRFKRKRMGTGSNIVKLEPEIHYKWFKAVYEAVECLKSGGVIAVPTDTLYGLCTLVENSERLYKLKKRTNGKPLGLFLNDGDSIFSYAEKTVPNGLVKSLFPGPVTLIFNRTDKIPLNFNSGIQSVGFRIPQAHFIRDICRFLPFNLIAQTSANISGSDLNPIKIEDFVELWDEIDLIFDGGTILENNMSRLGSTVIDLSLPGQFKILRVGCAEQETINILHDYGLKSIEEIQREKIEADDIIKTKKLIQEERNDTNNILDEERQERIIGN